MNVNVTAYKKISLCPLTKEIKWLEKMISFMCRGEFNSYQFNSTNIHWALHCVRHYYPQEIIEMSIAPDFKKVKVYRDRPVNKKSYERSLHIHENGYLKVLEHQTLVKMWNYMFLVWL